MDSRDLWENQVNLLTKHYKILSDDIQNIEARISYFENVLLTLLVALKQGGIIVDSEGDTDNSGDQTYEFKE